METTSAGSWSDMAQPCDMDLWVMKWRSIWPTFRGPVILSKTLKTILSEYESVWPNIWPQINVSHCDLYFMVQWLCLIPWKLFLIWTSLFGIMNQYDLIHDLKINVGHCDLYFMVQWFCVIYWSLFDGWWLSLGIMGQYDQMFDLKINVGLYSDLYFMVHWFYLISQRLFDGWVSYFQIMRQCDTNFDLSIKGQYDLYFLVWWFCLIPLNLYDHSWYVGSVWRKDWPHQVYVGQWPIFYGPVVWLHILKTIWWRSVVLGIMDQCDSKIDLLRYMWVSDLSFMVHWFCLLSLS